MKVKLAWIAIGCGLIGAAGAAWHRVGERPAAVPLLFVQAAIVAPTTAAWPPTVAVAHYEETFALLTMAAMPRAAARATAPQHVVGIGVSEAIPQDTGAAPRRDTAIVHVVIRDRYGRPLRVEAVERPRPQGARGHVPPPRYPMQAPLVR